MNDSDGKNDDDNDRMRWIASLDVFDGGQDYTHSADMASYPPDSSLPSSFDPERSRRLDDDRRDRRRIRDRRRSRRSSLGSRRPRRRRRSVPLFVDDVGNTALHLACRRDPPLRAVRDLARTRPEMVWMTTSDGSLPLHLACHCGCDPDVAGEILDVMERTTRTSLPPRPLRRARDGTGIGTGSGSSHDGHDVNDIDNDDDPLFPRDCRGRTPLHLACASSRDPSRRTDLIRLLLLRSNDPRRLALSRDWLGGRLGLDCAMGQLTVIVGGLDNVVVDDDDGSIGAGSVGTNDGDRRIDGAGGAAVANGARRTRRRSSDIAPPLGRTPLDLIEDDYREELDDASFLAPGRIAEAIALRCGGGGGGGEGGGGGNGGGGGGGGGDGDVGSTSDDPNDAIAIGRDDDNHHCSSDASVIYECWATLSILLLAAGTSGDVGLVKEALGGVVRGRDDDDSTVRLGSSFPRPCHEVVRDFQLIYKACQSLSEEVGGRGVVCPPHFKELAKRLMKAQVDRRSLGSVSELKDKWERRSVNSG